jgi:hypothetical protein
VSQENLFTAPAGWYPDPLGIPQLRWWNSQGWTEQVSEALKPVFAQETQFAWKDDEPPAPAATDNRPPAAPTAPVVPTLGQLEAPRATKRVEDPSSYDAPSAAPVYQVPVTEAPVYQVPVTQAPVPEPAAPAFDESIYVVPVVATPAAAAPEIPRYPETPRAAARAESAPAAPAWDIADVDPYASAPAPSIDPKDLSFWSGSRPEDIRRQLAEKREREARERGE